MSAVAEPVAGTDGPPPLPRGLEFVRLLGQGGMGYVVLARDPNLRRLVAVKFVLGGALVPDAVDRLLREGRALAALRHPRVIAVYESVRVGSDVALIMTYIEGSDLERLLVERPPAPAERLRLLDQVAEAVEAVNDAGIVHRDLKPPNVLVDTAGNVFLADFGLARLGAAADMFRTDPAIAIGTPFYAPPEQLTDPEHEHPAIDAWAFAVLAHRTLTGDLPAHPALGGTPTSPFDLALSLDPLQRIRPRRLMELLHAEPLERWPDLVGSDRAPAPAAVTVAVPLTRVELAITPARTSRFRSPIGYWPLLAGLLLGALAAAVAVLLR